MCVILPNMVVLGQTVYDRNCRNPPEKFDPSSSAFEGHSTASEPTQIDLLLMTSC